MGNHYTSSNHIHINYYGQTCDLLVAKIITEESTVIECEDKKSAIEALEQIMQKLNVTPQGDVDSLPSCEEYKGRTVMSFVEQTHEFSEIQFGTRINIETEEILADDLRKVTVGLADFGGYQKQMKQLKDMIELHLFKSETMLSHGKFALPVYRK